MKTEPLKMDTPLPRVFRILAPQLDATEPTPAVWASVLGGAGLGLLWGIAARIWMRLISTRPEFSVFGTVAIFVIATLFGAWAGLAFVARRRGWRRWGHYLPRSLAVIFFVPFSAFGGAPLMLTVLLATLGVVQRAVVGLWFLAGLAILVVTGTDFGLPAIAAGIAVAAAIALTAWKLFAPRWRGFRSVDAWLERIVRGLLLILALVGFGYVARDILSSKPIGIGLVYVCFYFILLYALFLALRIGLQPVGSTGAPH